MPSRVGINRDAKYCDRLMSLNCNLLPLNSRLPSEANAVVVTISGSVAIESSKRLRHNIFWSAILEGLRNFSH